MGEKRCVPAAGLPGVRKGGGKLTHPYSFLTGRPSSGRMRICCERYARKGRICHERDGTIGKCHSYPFAKGLLLQPDSGAAHPGGAGQGKPGSCALSGRLCHGIGQSGDACGILTGGCCVLSYLVGPYAEDGVAMPKAKIVQEEFVDWFRAACEEKGAVSTVRTSSGRTIRKGLTKAAAVNCWPNPGRACWGF